jgi:rhodanese-related sulfurtransferase
VNAEQVNDIALSPERATELVEAGAELIDVRRPYEYEGGRLAGSRNIEMNDLAASAEELPRDRPVIVYCRSGNRSGMAAEALRHAGYDAYSLVGGIEAWAATERPLEPEDGEVRAPLPAT